MNHHQQQLPGKPSFSSSSHMGEQPQSQTQSPSFHHHSRLDSSTTTTTTSPSTTAATTTTTTSPSTTTTTAPSPSATTTTAPFTVAAIITPTHFPPPPAPPPKTEATALPKIPLRPRKIRKLSSDSSTSDNNSDSNSQQEINNNNKTKNTKIIVHQVRRTLPRIVARTLSCEGELSAAIRHLRSSDPVLARVIDVHQPPTFDSFHPPFLALTKSILYQQLAFKAGTSIYTRFVSLCGGESGVVPESVLALNPNQLRQIGVSARKASYLHDLANKYKNGILSDSSIIDMDDKSLFTMLTMVKGIGSWSVHMFMIFSLHRPDVLPIGDLGIRKGVQLLYGLEQLPRPSQMDQLCEKWRPYRSVASWYMWRHAEVKGPPSTTISVVTGSSSQQQQQQQLQLQQQPYPHQHQLQQQQQQQPLQLIDPMGGIANLGCSWGP